MNFASRAPVAAAYLFALAAPGADIAFGQTSPSAFTTGYRYSMGGQLTGVIRPDPDDTGPLAFPAVRNTYGSNGLLIRVETGQLLAWQPETVNPAAWSGFTVFRTDEYAYDYMGQRTSQETKSGGVSYTHMDMSYDAMGRVECIAKRMNPSAFGALPASCTLGPEGDHGRDQIIRTTYDARGLPLTIQRAYGTPLQQAYATYAYSPNGKVRFITDANGNVSELTYDGHDRLKQWTFPSPAMAGQVNPSDFEHYTYDENGNRLTWRRRDGQTIGFTYDALNRMTMKDIPGTTTQDVYFGYDLRNLPSYARFGSTAGDGVSTGFDQFGRLITSTTSIGGVTRSVVSHYDGNGNRTSVRHPDDMYFEYAYDGLDRVMHISENGPASTLASIFYDPQGRRSHVSRGNDVTTTTYGYDPVSRLASITHNLDGTGLGNDVAFTFSYNPANQIRTRTASNGTYDPTIVTAPGRTYSVNGLNQYTQISGGGTINPTSDSKGNLSYDGVTTFTYDIENRLIHASANNTTLTYDPPGRLHQVAATSGTTQFLYDGDRLIAEYDGAGTLLRRYVHGPGTDEPLVWYEGSAVGSGNRRYMHADHQGSIIAVTGTSGTTLNTATYDPYGSSSAPSAWRFRYTGQAAIPEIGLAYYKARFYSPTLGRFLQTDPVGFTDDLNLYAYVGNDPVNKTDPTGLAPPGCGGGTCGFNEDAFFDGLLGAHDEDINFGRFQTSSGYRTGVFAGLAAVALVTTRMSKGGRPARGGRGPVDKGKQGEQKALGELETEGYTVVSRKQVTVRTANGTRKYDGVVEDAEGNLCGVECKNGDNARKTANQRARDAEVQSGQDNAAVGGNARAAGIENRKIDKVINRCYDSAGKTRPC